MLGAEIASKVLILLDPPSPKVVWCGRGRLATVHMIWPSRAFSAGQGKLKEKVRVKLSSELTARPSIHVEFFRSKGFGEVEGRTHNPHPAAAHSTSASSTGQSSPLPAEGSKHF